MNNEEKILVLLEQMNARQHKTDMVLEQMRADMGERFDYVDEKLEFLETCISFGAKDALSHIQLHEKEFHHT